MRNATILTGAVKQVADLADADHLSDAALASRVAGIISRPRQQPADSFVLHAPLELAARVGLLPFVRPDARPLARRRLVLLAEKYGGAEPLIAGPSPASSDLDRAAADLGRAIDAGDLDAVDVAAWTLGHHGSAPQLRRLLSAKIAPRLSAAAHGSIFLYQLPRVAPRGELSGELLRPLARELARHPDWTLGWIDGLSAARPERDPRAVPAASAAAGDDGGLFAAIAATPQLGISGGTSIHPIMSQVDRPEVAGSLLSDAVSTAEPLAGARAITRAAAWSMLQEPVFFAPYGWSHALTMSQAVLGIGRWVGEPSRVLAIAATYVIGFRAALASVPLSMTFDHVDPGVDVGGELVSPECDPDRAAAAAWHVVGGERREALIADLATFASVSHDAHLVKHTLACLDASAADPDCSRLYLAAAAKLAGLWASTGDPQDPLV